MSDMVRTFTDEEQRRCVRFAKVLGDTDNLTEQHTAEWLLRWDATLRQAEDALAEMTRERDAALAELAKLQEERRAMRDQPRSRPDVNPYDLDSVARGMRRRR